MTQKTEAQKVATARAADILPARRRRSIGPRTLLGSTLLAGIIVLAAAAAPASAGQGLHWFQQTLPTFSVTNNPDGSATATSSGQVAGAGTYITAVLGVTYSYPTTCSNGGADSGPVPGKSGGSSATSSPVQVQAIHGNASFTTPPLTVSPPSTLDASQVCRNHGSGWTATAGPITITSATVTVTSSNGGTLSYTQKAPF